MAVEIHGEVAPGFEKVRDVFASNWEGIEVGASVSAYHRGEKVVDLWGGYRDRERTEAWEEDTLVNVYSTTKGMGTLAVALAVEAGRLRYEAPVVEYWPEFGAEGKERVTVAQLLSHQAGVCGVDEKLEVEDLYDWDKMVRLLAAQKPHWEPGTAAGYHAVTWGFLAGELVRRATGRTLGQYFSDRVAKPLGADFFIGLPDSEMDRVADMIGPNRAASQRPSDAPRPPAGGLDASGRPRPGVQMPPLYRIALENPQIKPYEHASSYAWRRAEIAAANGQANARGIARIYAALAVGGELDGVRVIGKGAIDAACIEEVGNQRDLVIGMPMRRSRGYILNSLGMWGPGVRAFGHSGAGGSTGFADPDNGVGFGYAMNQMEAGLDRLPRSKKLVDAVYDCL